MVLAYVRAWLAQLTIALGGRWVLRVAGNANKRKKPKSGRADKKARRAATNRGLSDHRVTPDAKFLGLPLPLVGLVLLVLVIVSGVQVADQAHEVRRLHATLETLGKQYNALLAENTRLTLERGARASFAHVEQQAVDSLGMHFPQQIVTVIDAKAAP